MEGLLRWRDRRIKEWRDRGIKYRWDGVMNAIEG